jgi:hypothetical protein
MDPEAVDEMIASAEFYEKSQRGLGIEFLAAGATLSKGYSLILIQGSRRKRKDCECTWIEGLGASLFK